MTKDLSTRLLAYNITHTHVGVTLQVCHTPYFHSPFLHIKLNELITTKTAYLNYWFEKHRFDQ